MKVHELKCVPESFQAIYWGDKTADFRRNDRDYQVGDILILRAWDTETRDYVSPEVERLAQYHGLVARVSHMETGFGIPEGYVMLSIKRWRAEK